MRVYFVNAEIYADSSVHPIRWVNATYTAADDERGEEIVCNIRDSIAGNEDCEPGDVRILGMFKL